MTNKAHTATINRLVKRYRGTRSTGSRPDIVTRGFVIEVETSATLADGVAWLRTHNGAGYVAVTNKECLNEAKRLVEGTNVGVMDPQGEIVRRANGRV